MTIGTETGLSGPRILSWDWEEISRYRELHPQCRLPGLFGWAQLNGEGIVTDLSHDYLEADSTDLADFLRCLIEWNRVGH